LLDALSTPADRWRRLIIETAHLHEWLPRTGLAETKRTHNRKWQATKLGIGWSLPPTTTVDVGTASLMIGPGRDTEDVRHSPTATIRTGLSVVFEPKRSRTLDDLHRRYAIAFLALMMVAADRPDTVTREIVRGQETSERAVVLRAGEPVVPQSWRRNRGYLFRAEDLPDLERSLRAWFRLWSRVGNAIAVFGDAISEGNSFSRMRFLSVFTALEGYQRVIVGGRGNGVLKLKSLRDRGGVDPVITGCTTKRLELMVATRNWFSHLGNIPPNITPELIAEEMFDSTRRAAALMQSCLLRDLGIPKARRNELMADHYRNWRIPG
jgi:hypothetical protein